MTPLLAHFKGINGGDCILQCSHLYLLRGGVAGYCPETSVGPRSVGRPTLWMLATEPSVEPDRHFLPPWNGYSKIQTALRCYYCYV